MDSRTSDAPSSTVKEDSKSSDDAAEQIPADVPKDEVSTIPDVAIEGDALDEDSASTPQDPLQSDTSVTPTSRPETPLKSTSIPEDSAAELENVAALREAHEALSTTHREEVTAHLERIDALQAKLKYLAAQAATSARSTANDSEPGSVDRKLAEKDEQIALLMEEGQALSKKELSHLGTIKKLRAKVGEDEKTISDLRRRIAKTEGSVSDVTDRAKRAEAQAKAAENKVKQLEKVEKEKHSFKTQRDEANRLAEDLRRQLAAANDRADAAEAKAQKNAGEDAKRRVTELQDELSDARIEKKLAEDRAKKEAQDVRDEAERQKERAKIVENELRGEIGVSKPWIFGFENLTECSHAPRISKRSSKSSDLAQKKYLRLLPATLKSNSSGKSKPFRPNMLSPVRTGKALRAALPRGWWL